MEQNIFKCLADVLLTHRRQIRKLTQQAKKIDGLEGDVASLGERVSELDESSSCLAALQEQVEEIAPIVSSIEARQTASRVIPVYSVLTEAPVDSGTCPDELPAGGGWWEKRVVFCNAPYPARGFWLLTYSSLGIKYYRDWAGKNRYYSKTLGDGEKAHDIFICMGGRYGKPLYSSDAFSDAPANERTILIIDNDKMSPVIYDLKDIGSSSSPSASANSITGISFSHDDEGEMHLVCKYSDNTTQKIRVPRAGDGGDAGLASAATTDLVTGLTVSLVRIVKQLHPDIFADEDTIRELLPDIDDNILAFLKEL